MALGQFVFRALGFSFQTQGRGLETPWAEIDVAGRFDALQWTGPKSESFSIAGVIFDPEFGGQETLDGLRQAAANGIPLMLVTRSGKVGGRHVVTGVTEDRSEVRGSGDARLNRYTIELRRYHGQGVGGALASALGRLF